MAKKLRTEKKNAAKMWVKKSLPLLQALKSFKPGQERTTLLGYLNDEACESIYHMIANILRNDAVSMRNKKAVIRSLGPHKKKLRSIAGGRKKTVDAQRKFNLYKRRTLMKMGGGVLSTLLKVGIPLLLSLLKKR